MPSTSSRPTTPLGVRDGRAVAFIGHEEPVDRELASGRRRVGHGHGLIDRRGPIPGSPAPRSRRRTRAASRRGGPARRRDCARRRAPRARCRRSRTRGPACTARPRRRRRSVMSTGSRDRSRSIAAFRVRRSASRWSCQNPRAMQTTATIVAIATIVTRRRRDRSIRSGARGPSPPGSRSPRRPRRSGP